MLKLDGDWLTSGLIDFEYKKYVVLAYLKDIGHKFGKQELYPFLSDLIFHYQNLQSIKENKKLLYQDFPKVISKADFEKLKLNYKKIIEDDEIMRVIEELLVFSLPHFKDTLNSGKDVYEFAESKIEISPIGISPIFSNEGYMFINRSQNKDLKIYRYKVTTFEGGDEKLHGLQTEYMEDQRSSLVNTFEAIKLDLIKRFKNLPNPATYLVVSHAVLPYKPTLLPVAKRLLLRHIQSAA